MPGRNTAPRQRLIVPFAMLMLSPSHSMEGGETAGVSRFGGPIVWDVRPRAIRASVSATYRSHAATVSAGGAAWAAVGAVHDARIRMKTVQADDLPKCLNI